MQICNRISDTSPSFLQKTLKKNYLIKSKIGAGAYGVVYEVVSFDGSNYAAKAVETEKIKKKNEGFFKEYRILKKLKEEIGFPFVKDFLVKNKMEILIINLLGSNLKTNFESCGGSFTLKTVLMIGYQAIERLEALHSNGFIHRDIKPENFVIGRYGAGRKIIHLIDFGLSCSYLDEEGNHISYKSNSHVSGTLYYMSVYGHLGIQATRRDDLISLGFMLVHLFKGRLPWYYVKGTPKEIIQALYCLKSAIIFKKFCEKLPDEFIYYFEYVFSLTYFEKPNYSLLKQYFTRMMDKNAIYNDGNFDWIPTNGTNEEDTIFGIDLKARKISCESPNLYLKKSFMSVSFDNLLKLE